MKSKNRLIIFSLIALLIISSMFLLSYGFYHTQIEGNETSKKATLSSQTIKVEYSDGSESLISSANDNYFYPGSTLTKTFTIKNTGNVEAKYSINLNDVVNLFTRKQDLIYELKSNDTVLSTGTFPTSNTSLLKKEILAVDETKTYTLKINYLESTENQIEDNGEIISGNIYIDQNIKYITDLKIYGNTTQDGTPTPSSPIEVLSLGDHSKNLFDIGINKEDYIYYSEQSKSNMNVSFTKNSITSIGDQYGLSLMIRNKNIEYVSGTNMNVSLNTDSTFARIVIRTFDENGNNISSNENLPTGWIYNEYYKAYYLDITKWTNPKYNGIFNYNNPNVSFIKFGMVFPSSDGKPITFSNIQLEEGSSPTSYKPHNYIDVVNSGKNLFNIDEFISLPGNSTYYSKDEEENLIQVAPDYRAKESITKFLSLPKGTFTTTINSSNSILYIENNQYSNIKTIALTTPKTIGFKTYSPTGTNLGKVQIEKGTDSTNYEPYQIPITTTIDLTRHDPLRKIGDVSDYIDYKNKKIIRNIGKYIITGTENWAKYSSAQTYYMTGKLPNAKYTPNILIMCNQYLGRNSGEGASYSSGYNTWIQSTSTYPRLYFTDERYNDSSAFTNHLAQQNTNGTPVIVYYQLATPVEETIELPEIDAQPFTNNITACDESMCATNIESSYE